MKRIVWLITAAVFMLAVTDAAADELTGTYEGHEIALTLSGSGGQYTGRIESRGQTYPLTATRDADRLRGTFTAGGEEFAFTARLSGGMLSLETGGTTHILQRTGDAPQPANPLTKLREQRPARRPPDGPAPSGDAVRYKLLSVNDPGINNMEALTFLVPDGWKVEGGIQWFPDFSILANLLMRVSDPQSGAAIEFLPIQNFTMIDNPPMPMQRGQNYMGNIVCEPITDVPAFIQTFYMPQTLRHLQRARVVDRQHLDKVAEAVARSYGGQSQVVAARVRYAFDHDGQPWEEDVYVTLVFTRWQLGTMWSVNQAYSFRAPRGQLDRMTPVMAASINSLKLNMDWFAGYQHVQHLFRNRMRQGIEDARRLSQTITANAEHSRKLYADMYREQQESQQRISESFGEYIRGVDTYRNPYEERQVQLPAGYNDAWVNIKGEYILSNQAGFDPNVGDTSEWRRMDRRGEER